MNLEVVKFCPKFKKNHFLEAKSLEYSDFEKIYS